MATSTIRLYSVGFKPSQNAILDNIETYLNSIERLWDTSSYQYVKHGLDISLKFGFLQVQTTDLLFNYVAIKNSDDTRTFYYYVNNVEWRAQQTIEVSLSLDTLNTFKDLLTFNNNTVIYRQHKDRFVKPSTVSSGSFTTNRIVDKVNEDTTGLQKYMTTSSTIKPSWAKWYLVYCTSQGNNVSDASSNTAIDCYLVPEEATTSPGVSEVTFEDLLETHNCLILTSPNLSIDVDGVTISVSGSKRLVLTRYTSTTSTVAFLDTSDGDLNSYATSFSNDSVITFNGTVNATNQFNYNTNFYGMDDSDRLALWQAADKEYNTFYPSNAITLGTIDQVNRTLSYLVKIIECPYAPIDISNAITNNRLTVRWTTYLNDTGMYALKVTDLTTEFQYTIDNAWTLSEMTCTIPANRTSTEKSSYYESKLYNSDYFTYLFAYDSFTKPIPLENISASYSYSTTPELQIKYKQSNAINSNLYFEFSPLYMTWTRTENLESFLICNRNNEYPIYNSSYLDYIRTGYNFDKKAKSLQLSQGWINTGLNVAGALGSFAISGVTGGISAAAGISLLTSSINSIASTIYSGINAQNQIEQKIAEAKATAASASGSDDLNLMNGYQGNKLKNYKYSVSDEMKSKMFELFYKTGYACNESNTPNTSSRYRFNYLQCDPGLVYEKDPRLVKYIEDIKERYRLGVTYFHIYDDFEQLKENWEVWLM